MDEHCLASTIEYVSQKEKANLLRGVQIPSYYVRDSGLGANQRDLWC